MVSLHHSLGRLELCSGARVHGLADLHTHALVESSACRACGSCCSTMSCRVAWIIARFALLIVLNSPAPMSAEQLRVNLSNKSQSEARRRGTGSAART